MFLPPRTQGKAQGAQKEDLRRENKGTSTESLGFYYDPKQDMLYVCVLACVFAFSAKTMTEPLTSNCLPLAFQDATINPKSQA